jgi:hypothetical protein
MAKRAIAKPIRSSRSRSACFTLNGDRGSRCAVVRPVAEYEGRRRFHPTGAPGERVLARRLVALRRVAAGLARAAVAGVTTRRGSQLATLKNVRAVSWVENQSRRRDDLEFAP